MKRLLLVVLLSLLNLPLFAQNPDLRGLKTVVSQLEGETAVVGKQYAVLIAIDKYQNWMALRNPVEDAKEIKEILSRRYYFSDFMELYDEAATKADIIKLFNKLISGTKPEDSILIFFAGHGYLDKSSNLGFWIPVDGGTDVDEQANWLPNAQVRGFISNMKARHVALIADSCFSGDILNPTRGMAPTITNGYFKNAYARVSRQVLTSGASESVPDESQFTRQLKLALEGNTSPYLDPLMLYNQIRLGVTRTTPLFGDLKDSGHQEGSSFLLFLKNGAGQPAAQKSASGEENLSAKVKVSRAYGAATVETDTSGTLFLDGISQGQVPVGSFATIESLVVGPHELEMLYDDGQKEKQTITVKMGKTTTVEFNHPVKTVSKVPPAESGQTPAAEAPAEGSQKDTLQDGDPLPQASIQVGNFDEWNGILPAFSQAESSSPVSFFDKIYLAMDAKNFYMRIDIRDMPYHSLYGLDLENGMNHVVAEVRFDKDINHWFVEVGNTVGTHIELIDGTSGYCSIKGPLLEVAFPLGSIRKNLGTQGSFRVTARTGYSDRQWSWVENDRSVAKQFIFPLPAQPSAAGEGGQKDALQDGDPLPQAAIKIDGKFDDWKGILPAFASGTAFPAEKNLAIDKVFLAVDAKNLYLRLDVKDDTPSSFFHPNNFDTRHNTNYALGLSNGGREVEAHIQFHKDPRQNRWMIEIFKKVNGGAWEFVPANNNYSMKGSSLEASFELEQLKKALGDLSELSRYDVRAYISYPDDQFQNYAGCDGTETKQFTF